MRTRFLFCLLIVLPASLWARSDALSVVEEAIEVLKNFQKVPEQRIPESLLRDAEAVAVVPSVIKAGLVIGGRRGHGLLSIRSADGSWSHPAFISLTGGSVGFQAGVQSTDVILVFKTRRSIESLINGTFTLGADASVAAGPVGREANAATDIELKAEIYAYSRSRGLFAGVALDGSSLKMDFDRNESIYGNSATPRRIFAGQVNQQDPAIVDFRDMLEETMSGMAASR